MDIQQPALHNSNICHSLTSTASRLGSSSSVNNIQEVITTATTAATTNSTSSSATVVNINAATVSPSTSSATSFVNNHHRNRQSHYHDRNTENIVTQKMNQVTTVLLHDIPIVSLYIEGQERLCLAQISNTLLKQFSYNEIHNRRVALGITCVQCTPVQLELLRRAGAMPVSSRRCGMITRREAERLCKSFLGDNTPPRLPEDFAFSVQHKCSWGCRGSFLPSRYNSSRAKCIKCHYCRLFFSPNKFIFHSHRIGPGDKYVQPDAANFNSWRRHMMLSGQPSQEVIYAWEDVKAMFNGGTRKRLMSADCASPLSREIFSSPNSCSAGRSTSSLNRDQGYEDAVISESLPNNIQKVQKVNNHHQKSNSVNTVKAAAAAVDVTAVAVDSTIRPLNRRFHTTAAATDLATESSYSVTTDTHLMSAVALPRSFMDCMWQHAHQAAKNTCNQPKIKSNNSGFTFPWINTAVSRNTDHQNPGDHLPNVNYTSSVKSRWQNASNSSTIDITRNLSQIINKSAFKLVPQQHEQQQIPAVITPSTTKLQRQRHSSALPISTRRVNETNISVPVSLFSTDDYKEDHGGNEGQHQSATDNKNQIISDNNEATDDDILVDIETTEDDNNIDSRDEILNEENTTDNDKQPPSDEDVIDVVHNDNDDTILKFGSVTSLAIIKHSKENERLNTLSTPYTFISPVSSMTDSKDLDKLCGMNYSNTENVPPQPISFSPKSNSLCSWSSEQFSIENRSYYESTTSPTSVEINPSRTSENIDDQRIHFSRVNLEVNLI